ncbi:MAG: DinB family protein [Janthinobacterium lividum]
MTIQEYIARATQKKAQELLAAARALPEERQHWKPLGQSRSAVDLVAECAIMNQMSVQLLQERTWNEAGRTERQNAQAALDTLEKAAAALLENTDSLAAAIRAVSEEDLALTITLPGETTTVCEDLLHSYWNMSYHEGQINYIQTLGEVVRK